MQEENQSFFVWHPLILVCRHPKGASKLIFYSSIQKKTSKRAKNESYQQAGVLEQDQRDFPTDYEQDLGSSDRAGYPIYRSTAEGHYYDYICDLGNRLEVNLDSSHLATVNIWIEEPAKAEDNVQAGVEAMHAAKALGQTISPLYDNRQFTLITLCVDGDRYIANDTMRKVYDGLKRGESWLASDLIASRGVSIDHYAHGKNGENGGHFIVQGYNSRG